MPYEIVRATGMAASTQGRGRMLCRLRDQTYAYVFAFLNGANSEIRVRIGAGIGSPWSEEVVAATPGNDLLYPCIAVDSRDNLHVAYANVTTGHVYYIRRSRLTATWETPVDLPDAINSQAPVLAVGPSDEVACVWAQVIGVLNRCCYRQRSYAGVWSVPTILDVAPSTGGHAWPSIAYDTLGNLHISTYATGYGTHPLKKQVIYMRRNSNGSLGTQIQLTDDDTDKGETSIAVDLGNVIHLVWSYPTDPLGECYWSHKALNDATFIAAETVKPNMALPTTSPSIGISKDGALHVDVRCWWGGINYGIFSATYHVTDFMWYWYHWNDPGNPPNGNTALTPDPNHPSILHAMFPYINGVHTNLPLHGFAMAFSDDTAKTVSLFTFSGHGSYAWGFGPYTEPIWDDTLVWENTTEVARGPTVTTLPATAIDLHAAVLNAIVTDDQGAVLDVYFEWGENAGVLGAASAALGGPQGYTSIQSGKVTGDAIEAKLEGLLPGTAYCFRAVGLYSNGQVCWGGIVAFTTRSPETVTRIPATGLGAPIVLV